MRRHTIAQFAREANTRKITKTGAQHVQADTSLRQTLLMAKVLAQIAVLASTAQMTVKAVVTALAVGGVPLPMGNALLV